MNLVYTTIAKARCYKIKDLRCKELNFKDERRETPTTVFCLRDPSDKGASQAEPAAARWLSRLDHLELNHM